MRSLGYVAALDGIRAIAVALVVCGHARVYHGNGSLGVDTFFVLSGFLITALLLEEKHQTGTVSLRGFYARRFRRLAPALFAVIVAYAVSSAATGHTSLLLPHIAIAASYTTNLVDMLPSGRQFVGPSLGHLWSLGAEEQFYLLWPLVLFVALRANLARAVSLLAGALIVFAVWAAVVWETHPSAMRIGYGPDTRSATPLLVGCLLAITAASPARTHVDAVARWLWLPAVAICAFEVIAQPPVFLGWLTLFAFAAAIALTRALDASSTFARLLSLPPIVWIGKRSYSLYLWHVPIFAILLPAGQAIAIGASVVVAALSYRYIEQPFRRGRVARRTPTAERLVVATQRSVGEPGSRLARARSR